MDILVTKKASKSVNDFYCQACDYKCSRSCDWNRHILTRKHHTVTFGDAQVTQKSVNFVCKNCNKHYSSRNGLWRHRQKCIIENCDEEEEENTYQGINIKDKDALVLHLLKQNGDLQNRIIEMSSEIKIINNTNSHNTTNIDKSFNLNFFLNETCKNAMNITDFVSSIKVSIDDLENTGRQGYIKGISNIIIKNLNKLEQHLRPLHCSDYKREVLYIKDNNEWLKETDSKPILTKTIKTIANENIKQINKWREKYPDCSNSNSKNNDLYLKIVSNSMNGLTKEEGENNINKIISNVVKNVVIDK
jgi:hypothetical protein